MKPSLTIGHTLREPDDRSGFFARFGLFFDRVRGIFNNDRPRPFGFRRAAIDL